MNKTNIKHRCPHCRKEASWQENPHRPFCSERCKMIDLGAWMSEEYKIPGGSKPADDEDDESP